MPLTWVLPAPELRGICVKADILSLAGDTRTLDMT